MANVQQWGTGALNVDGCRVESGPRPHIENAGSSVTAPSGGWAGKTGSRSLGETTQGRWPSNVVLSHGDCGEVCEPGCPVAMLDQQSGTSRSPLGAVKQGGHHRHDVGLSGDTRNGEGVGYADKGGASRFFPTFRYQAKAPSRERPVGPDGTKHPTCKPLDLMRWLVRLVTPPGGIVLDPFAGSGTTLEAAQLEGFTALGVEKHAPYLPLIVQRLERSRIAPTVETDWTLDLFGDAA